ncbi:PPE domain-containing protein [Nocardia terpenica]|uniref:PPE domain-containing protein n=1 Tax=Nocardia terpenica TaxID=455432 RepID=A0A291RDA0_9NOCA|nr:hypothetical protein [Nocardia terpenica]ATL65556.1 hypothetical protein CRH09_04380 [Nocardia terpenica]
MGGNDPNPNWQFSPTAYLEAIAAGDPTLKPDAVKVRNAAAQRQEWANSAGNLVKGSGVDPDYIPGGIENFSHMPLEVMRANVDAMMPGVMHASAQAWNKVADAVMFSSMGLTAKVNGTISQGWEGATANAISEATRQFSNDLADIHNVMESVQNRIQSVAYAAEVVKMQMPPVSDPAAGTGYLAGVVQGVQNPAQAVGQASADTEAQQAAAWALANHYKPTYEPAGQQVPMFVPPTGPNGTGPDGIGTPGLGGNGGTNGGHSGGTSDSSGGESPKDGTQGGNQQNPDPSATNPASSGNSPGGQGGQATGPAVTSPAGTDSTATNPAGVGSGVGTSGGGAGRGGIGVPGFGGIGGHTGATAPGRSIPGAPVPAAAAGGALAGAARAAGAGTPGMPGMGAPGAKGKGEEDKERKGRPELLVHERNKLDLIGELTPLVPPVIGGDALEPSDDWHGRENPGRDQR